MCLGYFPIKCNDRDLHHRFVGLQLRMLQPIFLTLVNIVQFVASAIIQRVVVLGGGGKKRVVVFYTAAEDFSQNKPSHHFLWNLWFLSVFRIVEHCGASAHL